MNGILEDSYYVGERGTPYNTTHGFTVGTTPAYYRDMGFPRTFNGIIDELSIYDRALSPEEIQAVYEAGEFGKCK